MRDLVIFALGLSLSGASHAADDVAEFTLPSGVSIKIVEAPFSEHRFRVEGCHDDKSGCRINGRLPFGIADRLPKTYVRSITASYGGHSYALDGSDMYDAWGHRPLAHAGVIRYFGGSCDNGNNCILRGIFSDAGGAFAAEWFVVNGKSTRSILSSSNDVLDLFMAHIDLPTDSN